MAMRDLLLQATLRRPFTTFSVLVEGGFEIEVARADAIVLESSVLFIQVNDLHGVWTLIDTDRVVGLRTRRILTVPGR
jgi:hypothetical protein